MAGAGYIFGGPTGRSYEELQRQRAALEAQAARSGQKTARNVGEGLASAAGSLANAFRMRQLNKAREAMSEGFQADYGEALYGKPPGPVLGQEGYGVRADAGQPAQAPSADLNMLLRAATDPRAPPAQRSALAMRYKQALEARKPITVGNNLVVPDGQGGYKVAYSGGNDPTTVMQNYKAAGGDDVYGPNGLAQYQMQLSQAGASRNTTVLPKGEEEFDKTLGKELGKMFISYADGARGAAQNQNQLDRLSSLLAESNVSGNEAALRQILSDATGFNFQGDVEQGIVALISKMIPEQREAGSGPLSDKDINMFRDSLPRLRNTPGGNAIIIETMRGLNEYRMKLGDISHDVLTGKIHRNEGLSRVRALGPPIKNAAKIRSALGEGRQATPSGELPVSTTGDLRGADEVGPWTAQGISKETWELMQKALN